MGSMAERKTTPKSFSQLEEELDELLTRVESASYNELDELLADYERGSAIIEHMEKKLAKAKNSIQKVKNKTA